jgi:hypothetical protein
MAITWEMHAGAEALGVALASNHTLTFFNVASNHISDIGSPLLVSALLNNTACAIQTLILSHNPVKSATARIMFATSREEVPFGGASDAVDL